MYIFKSFEFKVISKDILEGSYVYSYLFHLIYTHLVLVTFTLVSALFLTVSFGKNVCVCAIYIYVILLKNI